MVMTAMSFVLTVVTAAAVVTEGGVFLMLTMFRMICVILMRHGGCVTAVIPATAVVTAPAVVTMSSGFLMLTMFRMIFVILMRHGGCVSGVVRVLA
jgi:hypothetical protein